MCITHFDQWLHLCIAAAFPVPPDNDSTDDNKTYDDIYEEQADTSDDDINIVADNPIQQPLMRSARRHNPFDYPLSWFILEISYDTFNLIIFKFWHMLFDYVMNSHGY